MSSFWPCHCSCPSVQCPPSWSPRSELIVLSEPSSCVCSYPRLQPRGRDRDGDSWEGRFRSFCLRVYLCFRLFTARACSSVSYVPMNLVPAGRFLAAAICLLSLGGNAALPNSSSVTVELDAAPISPIDADAWIVLRGNSNISVASVLAPDGSFTREFTAQAPGSVMVQNTLRNPIDLRTYDSFSFWARASTTRIGDFVYLIDAAGRKRWYSLLLWSQRGWQKPSYWLDAFVGQDTGFDPSSVTRLRFAQAGQVPGDRLWFGPVIFEHG